MEQRLTLITLGVDDLARMRAFYEEVFGWTPVEDDSDHIVFFQLNGIQLALYGRRALAEDARVDPEGSGFRSFTLAHNLRSEKAVDRQFDVFEANGVNIAKPPAKTFWGGYSGYIADPEDNLWEIAYNPYMAFDDAGNVVGS